MEDFKQRYIAARRAVIAQDLSRLNPMQRQAAMTTEGPLLLLAGAGSGKTTVLIQRVYNLLTYGRGSDSEEVPAWATEEDLQFLESFPARPTEEDVRRARRLCALDAPKPWEIIAITFTNKAAGELKDRLAARLGPEANDIWASTFHSACVRILRRDIDRLGFDKDFTIYDTDDSKRVIKDILKELNLEEKTFPPRSVLAAISHSKDQYETPEDFAKRYEAAGDWKMTRIAKIYAAYAKKLRTANALEYAMKRNGIPYKVVGGMKFFDRAEVKDMLAYLCVLNNPLDDLRLRRIINNPPRGIGATTLDKVGALAESQGASLYEIIRNADLFPELKASSAKLLKFADLIDGLRRAGTELALPEFYDAVCDQTGYVKALEEKNDMESRGRIENVQELKSNILGFLEQQPEDATLSGFLNEIALYTDLDSVEASDDCVTMMTIHSAKGLEFPVVYVVGMEEGIFPGASAQYDQEELEEERRLCYVAMTRAKEKLTLTNCRQRMLYGRTSANRASRFLEEIPEENMRWESKPEPRFGGMEHDGTFGGDRYEDGWGSSPARAGGSWSSGGVHSYRAPAQAPQRPLASVRQASSARKNAAPAAPLLQLQQGDMVEHTAFGKGMVLSVRPMGGDALAEVAFDTVGKKKLMLKSAGAHMRKL